MTRFIAATLTLTLITGLSSGKASAQQANAVPVLTVISINTNVSSMSLVDAGEEFDQMGISEGLTAKISSFRLSGQLENEGNSTDLYQASQRPILALSLAAALNDPTSAQANAVPLLALSLINTAEAPLEEIGGVLHVSIVNEGGSDLYQQNELEFSSRLYLFDDQKGIWNDITFNCHATPDAAALIAIMSCRRGFSVRLPHATADVLALIAIIAFEYGHDAAYVTLRDMGFSAEDADDVVIEAMSILSFEFQELASHSHSEFILQFNPREYTFTK